MLQPKISLQYIGPDDWQLYKQIRLRALYESPEAFHSKYDDWVTYDETQWRARLSSPDSCTVLALCDNKDGKPQELVGMASGFNATKFIPSLDPNDTVLIGFWVAPEYRGRQNKVSERLLNEIESWSQKQGMNNLLLGVVKDNQRAISFYQRMGYQHFQHDNFDRANEYLLGKKLSTI